MIPIPVAGQTYRCKYFKIEEIMCPELLKANGEELCWWMWNKYILWTVDVMRELYGVSALINNWKQGGQFSYRGARPSTYTQTGPLDPHKFLIALDVNFGQIPASTVINDILTKPNQPEFQFISGLELGVTWNHLDVRNVTKVNGLPFTFTK
jgi:hypothetical protein